ncbi:MAG: peroxide stress protein YaaA [Actinomycetia bacterium]|nr:peroxide stress protein YaaA [Actinomycetes bacterium]MCP3911351.1 peroxide stress protein YaaA [Actinomycetes bacterium]
MLIVVSPAKSLDYESPLATRKHSNPLMLDQSERLVGVMRGKSPAEIAEMMHISASLAELNFERFQDWERPFTTKNARPAVIAFTGDVYQGMDTGSFNERDFTHAQKVLRILSGLYGVLRPLDLMQPYRLEMGSKFDTGRGSDLYSFWGDRITDQLNADIAASPGPAVLINLASNEYYGSVQPQRLDARIITPTFLDAKGDGEHKIVAFFAKRARGAMTGWIIRNRIKSVKALTDFDLDGYRHSPERSSNYNPVFTRRSD